MDSSLGKKIAIPEGVLHGYRIPIRHGGIMVWRYFLKTLIKAHTIDGLNNIYKVQ